MWLHLSSPSLSGRETWVPHESQQRSEPTLGLLLSNKAQSERGRALSDFPGNLRGTGNSLTGRNLKPGAVSKSYPHTWQRVRSWLLGPRIIAQDPWNSLRWPLRRSLLMSVNIKYHIFKQILSLIGISEASSIKAFNNQKFFCIFGNTWKIGTMNIECVCK